MSSGLADGSALLAYPVSLPLGAPGRPYVPPPDFDLERSRSLPACHICGQSFTRTFNLNSHLKSHENVKPYTCSDCGMAFTRRHDLNRHARQHVQDRPFNCDMCGRTFLRKDALKRHVRMHESKGMTLSASMLTVIGAPTAEIEAAMAMTMAAAPDTLISTPPSSSESARSGAATPTSAASTTQDSHLSPETSDRHAMRESFLA
ncbi:hypothetical protein BC831DRAFT_397872 [Entophlyctis helioformis]|nr:hypothetical protein BC831DRAFT_397872 [Entophlyctis helioformis]